MKVYVFGNRDYAPDAVAFEVAGKLSTKFEARNSKLIEFVEVKPNEDLPFVGEDLVVILDVVEGIDEVTLITEEDLDKALEDFTARSRRHGK